MKKTEYNFSVIIPHKNSPELLCRCIDSIPLRDDVQIVVVDDNSDKNVVDWGNFSFKRDVELVRTTEGRGAGYARNMGLKYAKGSWVLFIDSDDTYTGELPILLNKYKNSPKDVIYFNYNRVTSNGDIRYSSSWTDEDMDNNKIFRMKYMLTAPWNKMVKRDFIRDHKIVFEECPVGNDVFYSYQVGVYSKDTFEVESAAIYNYQESYDSITRRKRNDTNYYLTICKQLYQCNAFKKHMGQGKLSRTMANKLVAILVKKGIREFLKCSKVYITNYREIKESEMFYVNSLKINF